MKKKALFIVGPTATGKTSLALTLAQKYNGALVSADSVQVYKTLDIISGKDIVEKFKVKSLKLKIIGKEFDSGYYEVNGVKIYLLDLASPEYSFNVSDYFSIAKSTIESLSEKNILPIVVGGTGFYVRVLVDEVETIMIPPNEELRLFLENKTVEQLTLLLKKSDLKKLNSMNESDRKNKRRLIRAIEIAEYQAANKSFSPIKKLEDYDILIIGLHADRQVLKQRIDARVEKRIEEGAFLEAEQLFKNYENISSSVKNANGYKQLFEFFLGKVTKEEAIAKWRRSEYLNAKKQMTWFSKDKRIQWFDIEDKEFLTNIIKTVEKWLW